VDESPTTPNEGTALPGLRGVDHIGITVPDMEQATAFFVDVLGCELLYEREPPRDDAPRDRLGVPAGSRIQGVHFLRCANIWHSTSTTWTPQWNTCAATE
jgi:catechol 2,3-dioxygenase-like lactoylglutathione lyase family enzyme